MCWPKPGRFSRATSAARGAVRRRPRLAAAGPQVEAALNAAGIPCRRHVIPARPRPKPTVELADTLRAVLRPGETPVAIGSGVMNDVVKHAAFTAGIPYLCVATAASMDGYTSAGRRFRTRASRSPSPAVRPRSCSPTST